MKQATSTTLALLAVGLIVALTTATASAQGGRGGGGKGGRGATVQQRGADTAGDTTGNAWQRGPRDGSCLGPHGPRGPHGPGGPGGPGGPDGMLGMHLFRCMQELDLTDEQKTELQTLRDAHRDEMKAQHDAMRTAIEAYMAALAAPGPDADQVTAAEQTIEALVQNGMEAKFDHARAVRAVLTDEQAAALAECLTPPEEPEAE